MIFYEKETAIALALCSIPFLVSVYTQFKLKKQKIALYILLFAAACIRLLFTSLDPYLMDWDEKFHALVSKHMMDFPLKPMLRLSPIIPYDMGAWCCNHIWVHKQPLFMWQMALSMKIFGVNEFAMRLPSAIMGTIMVYFIYQIVKIWTKKQEIGFIAAFLFAVNVKFLEIVAGNTALDHNDLTFSFYVTATIWAFCKYDTFKTLKWALIVGVFVGCAILNKWLTGLLVYAGWGIALLLDKEERRNIKNYTHIIYSFLASCVVFIPWQIYILKVFPEEAGFSFKHNREHISDSLGHPGDNWYHFDHAFEMYHAVGIALVFFGIFWIIRNTNFSKNVSIACVTMLTILYLFFSLIVKTKMPGFTYPIASVIFGLMAIGIYYAISFIPASDNKKSTAFLIFVCLLGFLQLSPQSIIDNRKHSDFRDVKIHNTKIFKQLDEEKLKD
jgi:4-amino-4-deoxy-L-arabinose transferase-like glycosyltransferase